MGVVFVVKNFCNMVRKKFNLRLMINYKLKKNIEIIYSYIEESYLSFCVLKKR